MTLPTKHESLWYSSFTGDPVATVTYHPGGKAVEKVTLHARQDTWADAIQDDPHHPVRCDEHMTIELMAECWEEQWTNFGTIVREVFNVKKNWDTHIEYVEFHITRARFTSMMSEDERVWLKDHRLRHETEGPLVEFYQDYIHKPQLQQVWLKDYDVYWARVEP